MDIRQLAYFVQIAECGSYSLASQKLYITQPALSKVIKNMEEEMGLPFFYTYQRRQRLTDAGQAFYERAAKLLKSYNELIETTYVDEQIDKGHLSVGLSVAAGGSMFAHVLFPFTVEYPMITFSILERETNLLKEEVLKKNLDLAYIDLFYFDQNKDSENFDVYPLVQSENVVVTCVDNPLSQMTDLDYEDLRDQNMILYNGGKEVASQTEVEMRKLGIVPNIVLISTQWNFILDAVANNMGVVFCPYYIYSRYQNPRICAIKLCKHIGYRRTGIITKKNEYQTRACTCFLDYATDLTRYDGIKDRLMYHAAP